MRLSLDNLRAWIGLMSLLAVLPAALVSGWMMWRDAEHATANAYERARLLAAMNARDLMRWVQTQLAAQPAARSAA